jgi:hypothetical protein
MSYKLIIMCAYYVLIRALHCPIDGMLKSDLQIKQIKYLHSASYSIKLQQLILHNGTFKADKGVNPMDHYWKAAHELDVSTGGFAWRRPHWQPLIPPWEMGYQSMCTCWPLEQEKGE